VTFLKAMGDVSRAGTAAVAGIVYLQVTLNSFMGSILRPMLSSRNRTLIRFRYTCVLADHTKVLLLGNWNTRKRPQGCPEKADSPAKRQDVVGLQHPASLEEPARRFSELHAGHDPVQFPVPGAAS
jgi:hypothetical protein